MRAVAVAVLAGASVAATAQAPLHECRVAGIRNSVQCGVVQRALDPARPEGPKIDVHYVVAPAMARRKLPDPVFVLAGGPGQSAIQIAPQMLALLYRLNNRRDIVFVDQRGIGRSAPLECEDPQREALADQADPDLQLKLLMQCKSRLLTLPYIKQESDLGFFTTTLAMQDLDAVRRQLGAARIDLVGASYGTRAGLEYLRAFPDAVRRVVLDGVAPPDMALPASFSTDGQAAFDALLAACDGDAACRRDHPTLRADWAALLKSLPKQVSAPHPLTGKPETFTLTREMLLGAVRGPLYGPALAAALPAAIDDAAHGRYDGIVGLGAVLSSRKGVKLAMGMHFSVVCAEDVPLLADSRDRPGADFSHDFAAMYQRLCSAWPRGSVPAEFYTIATSRAPVLLLSGGLDPATPPRHGERVARALGPAAQHVVVPNAGHGVMAIGCMRDVIYRFIDAAEDQAATGVDASCVKAIPRPPAFVPVTLPAQGGAS
ncbi:MAG TPA: alpha/beta hydrolase [Burkholderiaceae bacterium]|nr:alpha/beta hydrolase [Burkholderiaceae bacterium]